MKTVLERYPSIDYAIVHWPENELTPWVAAWGYDEEKGSWCQGHYFRELKDAMKYILRKLGVITEEKYVVTYNYQEDPELHGVFDTEEKAKAHIANIGGEYTNRWNCPWQITKMTVDEPPMDPVWI